MSDILIVGEAPNARGGGLTRSRVSELAGRPWEEWADWVNLLDEWPGSGRGKGSAWNGTAARRRAETLDLTSYDLAILLGRRVAGAMIPGGAGFPFFRWTECAGLRMAVIPHTSGIVRFWNEPENVAKARGFLTEVAGQGSHVHATLATGIADEGVEPLTKGDQMSTNTKARPAGTRKRRAAKASTAAPVAKRITGRDAVIAAFRAAGKPLTPNEAAALVIDSGVAPDLGAVGSTPVDYRLYAPIYREAKKGRFYELVSTGPSKFKLRSDAPASEPELVEALKKQVAKAKAAAKSAK